MAKPKWDVEVYFDFGCPFAYQAAVWLRDLKKELGDDLKITWRYFPIEQVNSINGEKWKVWDQPLDESNRIQTGFRAAVAAAEQGREQFEKFLELWLEARHTMAAGQKPLKVRDAAKKAGLDMDKFERDLQDPKLWKKIGRDYKRGKDIGVFGTPTFVFKGGESAYLKMRPAPPAEDAVAVWNEFVDVVVGRPYIGEIKRPQKPQS